MAKGVKTGGRQKGALNKVTADIRKLAQDFGVEAINTLADILRTSDNDQARIAAAKEILDRGFGKSMQPMEVDANINHGGVLRVPVLTAAEWADMAKTQQPGADGV